jgi:hypothetical protein
MGVFLFLVLSIDSGKRGLEAKMGEGKCNFTALFCNL